jgi:hypothetical protein
MLVFLILWRKGIRIDSFLDPWEGCKLGRRDLSFIRRRKEVLQFRLLSLSASKCNSDYPHLLVQTVIPKRETVICIQTGDLSIYLSYFKNHPPRHSITSNFPISIDPAFHNLQVLEEHHCLLVLDVGWLSFPIIDIYNGDRSGS